MASFSIFDLLSFSALPSSRFTIGCLWIAPLFAHLHYVCYSLFFGTAEISESFGHENYKENSFAVLLRGISLHPSFLAFCTALILFCVIYFLVVCSNIFSELLVAEGDIIWQAESLSKVNRASKRKGEASPPELHKERTPSMVYWIASSLCSITHCEWLYDVLFLFLTLFFDMGFVLLKSVSAIVNLRNAAIIFAQFTYLFFPQLNLFASYGDISISSFEFVALKALIVIMAVVVRCLPPISPWFFGSLRALGAGSLFAFLAKQAVFNLHHFKSSESGPGPACLRTPVAPQGSAGLTDLLGLIGITVAVGQCYGAGRINALEWTKTTQAKGLLSKFNSRFCWAVVVAQALFAFLLGTIAVLAYVGVAHTHTKFTSLSYAIFRFYNARIALQYNSIKNTENPVDWALICGSMLLVPTSLIPSVATDGETVSLVFARGITDFTNSFYDKITGLYRTRRSRNSSGNKRASESGTASKQLFWRRTSLLAAFFRIFWLLILCVAGSGSFGVPRIENRHFFNFFNFAANLLSGAYARYLVILNIIFEFTLPCLAILARCYCTSGRSSSNKFCLPVPEFVIIPCGKRASRRTRVTVTAATIVLLSVPLCIYGFKAK